MFNQVGLNLGMKFAFTDAKNAFCQSFPLSRPRGPLWAEPCEGLGLPPGVLIAIDIPVYGLDDAPAAWRFTVSSFLVNDLTFGRNLVEPCWFSKFDPQSGECVAQILVEVNDFIVAAQPSYYDELRSKLTTRFVFGKWEEDEAEYAGRRIQVLKDRILIDQSKYIIEQIHPIMLHKDCKKQKDQKLSHDEFQQLRSLVFRINWVGRETRPEACGIASIMASRLPTATISDLFTVNKFVNFLRSTANRPLIMWKFDPHDMCFIVCSDAGGINVKGNDQMDEDGLPCDATQGAWMVLTAEKLPEHGQMVKATPITWRSSKLRRKVLSTFGGETQAMLQGVSEVDWLQIMAMAATQHDIQLAQWRNSLSPHMIVMKGECKMGGRFQQCTVTDAKSLFDCLLKEHPSGKQDRKSSLELAIILKDLQETRSMVRWVPHQKMLVDAMTKDDPSRANEALNHFLKTGLLSLVDVQHELAARKTDVKYRRRSNQASDLRLREEYEANLFSLCSTLWSTLIGGMSKCSIVYLEFLLTKGSLACGWLKPNSR